MKKIGCFMLLVWIAAGLSACAPQGEPVSDQRFLLDTVCTITLYDSHDASIIDGAFDLIDAWEQKLSRLIETSEIAQINAAGGRPTTVSRETAELIALAVRYAELSGGRFDITVGAATELWNFKGNPPALPDAAALEAARDTVGYESIAIDGNIVTLGHPGTKLDLGAIAKGYIADRVKEYLISRGVSSAIINLGGNVLTVGTKPGGTPFRIGIRQPFADRETTIGEAQVADRSVVTSGIYERGFTVDGRYYHHILDPETGYPAVSDVESVTILSELSADGDALSTIAFLLGIEEATALVSRLDGIDAVFIGTDGSVVTTDGIGHEIAFTPES